MKIFNKDVVYVQIKDLMMLYDSDEYILDSVYDKIFEGISIIPKNLVNEFVCFSDKDEVNYFKNIDWIIDYKVIRKLSNYDINNLIIDINNEIIDISNNFNLDNSIDKYFYESKKELLEYKKNSLINILDSIINKTDLNIPNVIDCDGIFYFDSNYPNYKVLSSLNPNILFIYRNDKSNIYDSDVIPNEFIMDAIREVIFKYNTYEDVSYFKYISDDNKCLVIDINLNKNMVKDIEIDNNKGIKKIIRKIFNK